MCNYFVFIPVCIFLHFQHEMKGSAYKNVYNVLNNGLILNPHALLELSQSPLCISVISFNHFDIRLKFYVLQVINYFDLFDMKRKEVFKNAYNFLNHGPILNPLPLLELSQSHLCISFISFNQFNLTFNY